MTGILTALGRSSWFTPESDFLAARLRDPRFDFLFSPGDWKVGTNGEVTKDLNAWLAQWIGSEKPVSILDLSGIPVSVLVELVGALLRVVYDALFWARYLPEGGRQRPLLSAPVCSSYAA